MPNQSTRVVILAGGKGQRLQPYTTVLPKPLMPIGDASVLEVLLHRLRRQGFRQVTLAVSYLAELIQATCGDGSRFELEIRYSREETPLSTAGPLKLVARPDDTFLVINGDILTNIDFCALLSFHKQHGGLATVATHRRRVEIDYGVVETHNGNTLSRYVEKPSFDYLVSMGINVFEPRALDLIGENEALDMPGLLMRLRDAGERVLVFETDCLWLDIGRHDDYERAIELFRDHSADFLGGGGGTE